MSEHTETGTATKPPRRRHWLTMDLGADTYEDLVETLRKIADDLERDERPSRNWSSGGWSRGFTVLLSTDDTMTGDRFRAENRAYVDAMRSGSSGGDA